MRSNFFIVGVLIAAGVIIGGDYLIKKWDELDINLAKSLDDLTTSNTSQATRTTIYKWKDASGNWQFGDKAPEQGAYETSEVQGVQSIQMHTPSGSDVHKADKAKSATGISPLTPYTDPAKVQQLIEQARGVEQLMDDRKQQMDKQL